MIVIFLNQDGSGPKSGMLIQVSLLTPESTKSQTTRYDLYLDQVILTKFQSIFITNRIDNIQDEQFEFYNISFEFYANVLRK